MDVMTPTAATLKYAAAILHCPLAIFYITSRYVSSSYNGGINFSKGMINALPIPTNPRQKKQIVDLVDQILNRRVVDPIADIRNLEVKINAKLYALYKLTDPTLSWWKWVRPMSRQIMMTYLRKRMLSSEL